ncbi:Glycosyltransferase, GT2 family [Flavobacteriaceae bacterium MAR_2010_188]|nr:Glycosyltransferase, GT2 family [Flavobacteriaceae bacterium MAR_2010_188]
MIFSFLKYLHPVHYFILKRNNGDYIFPIVESLPISIKEKLVVDTRFNSQEAREYDRSWRAIKNGYVGETDCYKSYKAVPLEDNYRFTRKYFSKFWVFYVLLIRCITLHNPFKELRSFLKSNNISRNKEASEILEHPEILDFNSALIAELPKVSIIIPTLNRYPYLKDALEDLEKQSFSNFEVIVVDQSSPYQKEFYQNFKLDIKVIVQEERALWLARNSAIIESKGEYILLYDDDSRVASNWVEKHLICLDYFKAHISSGVSISKVGAEVPINYSYYRISDQLDTGNVMIKKQVFKNIGLFDRQFEKQRMGDGEFGLRAFLNGYKNISNPNAKRLHLKVDSGGLREMGSWDAFRTSKLFAPRPIPSVLYLFRKYFGDTAAKYAILKIVPFSIIPYRFKSNKILLIVGVFLTVLLIPYIIFQVILSWTHASQKLNNGALIPDFKN